MSANTDIPADVRSLIARHIDSVGRLELLLLIYRDADRAWNAEDAARELRIDAAWTAAQLDQLVAHGLIRPVAGPAVAFRAAAATHDVVDAVGRLAQAYADRRVSVVSLIYARPSDPLRTFADAFRFRKDSIDG